MKKPFAAFALAAVAATGSMSSALAGPLPPINNSPQVSQPYPQDRQGADYRVQRDRGYGEAVEVSGLIKSPGDSAYRQLAYNGTYDVLLSKQKFGNGEEMVFNYRRGGGGWLPFNQVTFQDIARHPEEFKVAQNLQPNSTLFKQSGPNDQYWLQGELPRLSREIQDGLRRYESSFGAGATSISDVWPPKPTLTIITNGPVVAPSAPSRGEPCDINKNGRVVHYDVCPM